MAIINLQMDSFVWFFCLIIIWDYYLWGIFMISPVWSHLRERGIRCFINLLVNVTQSFFVNDKNDWALSGTNFSCCLPQWWFCLQELQYKNNPLFYTWTLRSQLMFSSPNIFFPLPWFKIFCNVLKFFAIKTKIRESTHKSKLWAEPTERDTYFYLIIQGSHKTENTHLYRAAEAGCAQLTLKGREKHPERWELTAVGTALWADPKGLRSHHYHSPLWKTPLPLVPHRRGLFTNFPASTTCAGIRAKYVFTRSYFTSGIHLGKVHTSMPSAVFLTSYFNGINCLSW